jgi:hypothetical protein
LFISTTNVLEASNPLRSTFGNACKSKFAETSPQGTIGVQDRMTVDGLLALDAWKMLLYDQYNFGDGLDFRIIKLNNATFLYVDTPCCKAW